MDVASDPAPTGTRAALLDAALHLFGHNGFAATSVRQIAARAGSNVAAISYHFGGKDGLRLACGQEFVRRMGAAVQGALASDHPTTPEAARAQIEALVRRMLGFLCIADQADDLAPFMLREVAEGGPVTDVVYQALILPLHDELSRLWALATGQEPESETVRLAVFAAVGQVLYFRIARPVVTRRMGWAAIGPDQAACIADVLTGNLRRLTGKATT